MPRYSSASRQEAYENLLTLRRMKIISADVYRHKKSIIDKREAKAKAIYDKKQAEIEARRQAKLQETAKRNAIKDAFNKGVRSSKPFSMNLKYVDKVLGFKKFIDFITKSKKQLKMTINNITWVLNDNTKHKLLRLIQDEVTENEIHEASWGALVEYVNSSSLVGNITIEVQTKKHIKNKGQGAFFKYTHNTIFDLTRYGIYKTGEPQDHSDTCLLVALRNGGLESDKIDSLKLFVKNRIIPQVKLKEICNKVNICIVLKKNDLKHSKTVYGDKTHKTFHIGILDDHYFLVENTEITSFCLNHYDDVKHIEGFNKIYKNENGKYKKSNNRFIDSFDVIKILINNPLLHKEMSMEDRLLASTQFYDSISPEIRSLEYDADKCSRPIVASTGKDKTEYENVVFDFETYIKPDDAERQMHTPYLVRTYSNNQNKVFYGENCALQMLASLKNHTRLIAHNATYDFRFLLEHLWDIHELSRGSRLISLTAKFGSTKKHINIQVKDSLHLISEPLRKFPKMFGLDCIKEVMPYALYNEERISNRYVNIQFVVDNYIDKDDKEQFLNNIDKWNLRNGDDYDIVEYSSKYCELDCIILWNGYNKFRKWMLDCVNIDIDNKLTIASLAHTYFINTGCYDEVKEIGGIPQLFIQGCVVGGRTMCAKNEKIIIEEKVNDFDAVSLYPSAMARMDGFLKGLPKIIPAEGLNYDWLKMQDGYFVDVIIKSVGIARAFPLMSAKNANNIRVFSNDMVGKTIRVDKTTLEDLIEFQKIEFEVSRGYYFNDGFNTKVCDTIKYLFNERLNKKKEKNPAEVIYKLIMNSSYGKSIMKPVESESRFFDNEKEFDTFLSRNYNWCTSYTKFGNKTKVKMVKTLVDHFNIAQVGVCILSMSKRIMNEVMCLAEDNSLDIYYQDTDSMHIKDCDIKTLSDAFNEKYGRELIGKKMGQFHSDFDIKGCSNIIARRSIFLGKKSYIDELVGMNEKGEEVVDYHIRMKGIPNSCLQFASDKNNYSNVFDMYKALFNGSRIEVDLTNDGSKANFKYNPDYTCHTLSIFKRTMVF